MNWAMSAYYYFKSGVTLTDKCDEYHKALLVDPIYEVNPMMALADLVSSLVVRPMRHVGPEFGNMMKGLLEVLPWHYQVLIVPAFLVIFIFILILLSRSSIRITPFFEISPSSGNERNLTNQVEQLRLQLQNATRYQPPLLLEDDRRGGNLLLDDGRRGNPQLGYSSLNQHRQVIETQYVGHGYRTHYGQYRTQDQLDGDLFADETSVRQHPETNQLPYARQFSEPVLRHKMEEQEELYAAIDAKPKKIADRKLGKEKTVKDPLNEKKKSQLEEKRSQSEKSQSEEKKSQLEEKMHSEEKKSHSDEETSLSDDKRLKEDKKQDEKKIPVSLENIKETIAEESAISDDSIQGDDHVSKIDVNKESSSDDSNVNQIDIDEKHEKFRSTDAKTNVEDQILDKVCVGEDSSMATQQRTPPRNTAEGFHDVVSPKGKEFLDKVSVLLQPDPDASL